MIRTRLINPWADQHIQFSRCRSFLHQVYYTLLFLIYSNDIVHNLNSKIKLFADDAVLYSEVSKVQDVRK